MCDFIITPFYKEREILDGFSLKIPWHIIKGILENVVRRIVSLHCQIKMKEA